MGRKSGRVKVGRWGHPSADPARRGPAWPGYGTRGVTKRIMETGEEGDFELQTAKEGSE